MPDFSGCPLLFCFGSISEDYNMEKFICNCIATLMCALAAIAMTVMVCSFCIIRFGSVSGENPMFNCNIVESSNGVQNE